MIITDRPPTSNDAVKLDHPAASDKLVWTHIGQYADGGQMWNLFYISTVVSYWQRGRCCPWTNEKNDIVEWLQR